MNVNEIMVKYKASIESAQLELAIRLIGLLQEANQEANQDPNLVLDQNLMLKRFGKDKVMQLGTYQGFPVYVRKSTEYYNDMYVEFFTDNVKYKKWSHTYSYEQDSPAKSPDWNECHYDYSKRGRSYVQLMTDSGVTGQFILNKLIKMTQDYAKASNRWAKKEAREKIVNAAKIAEHNQHLAELNGTARKEIK